MTVQPLAALIERLRRFPPEILIHFFIVWAESHNHPESRSRVNGRQRHHVATFNIGHGGRCLLLDETRLRMGPQVAILFLQLCPGIWYRALRSHDLRDFLERIREIKDQNNVPTFQLNLRLEVITRRSPDVDLQLFELTPLRHGLEWGVLSRMDEDFT